MTPHHDNIGGMFDPRWQRPVILYLPLRDDQLSRQIAELQEHVKVLAAKTKILEDSKHSIKVDGLYLFCLVHCTCESFDSGAETCSAS